MSEHVLHHLGSFALGGGCFFLVWYFWALFKEWRAEWKRWK